MSLAELRAQLRGRWQHMTPREKTIATAAAVLVSLALLWWIAIAPALSTLRSAEAQHAALDGQLQQMLGLRAQAQALSGCRSLTSGAHLLRPC